AGRRPERVVRPDAVVLDQQHGRRARRVVEQQRTDADAEALLEPGEGTLEAVELRVGGRAHPSASTRAEARRMRRVRAGAAGSARRPAARACATAAATKATNSGCGRCTVL